MDSADITANLILWDIEDIVVNYANDLEPGQSVIRKVQVAYLPEIGTLNVYTDHNPPHFHVKTKKMDLKFEIETLSQITGAPLNSKQRKNFEHWYFKSDGQNKIIDVWNDRNPDNQISLLDGKVVMYG